MFFFFNVICILFTLSSSFQSLCSILLFFLFVLLVVFYHQFSLIATSCIYIIYLLPMLSCSHSLPLLLPVPFHIASFFSFFILAISSTYGTLRPPPLNALRYLRFALLYSSLPAFQSCLLNFFLPILLCSSSWLPFNIILTIIFSCFLLPFSLFLLSFLLFIFFFYHPFWHYFIPFSFGLVFYSLLSVFLTSIYLSHYPKPLFIFLSLPPQYFLFPLLVLLSSALILHPSSPFFFFSYLFRNLNFTPSQSSLLSLISS